MTCLLEIGQKLINNLFILKTLRLYTIVLLLLASRIRSDDNSFIDFNHYSNQNGLYQEKIMTYNVLHYDGEDNRDIFYQTIINQIQPDLLVCQEINGTDGFNSFLDNVLNIAQPGLWEGADFIDQSANNDIALYYKSEHFFYINTSVINTAQTSGTRNVVEWVMKHIATSVEFRIYGVHFKANVGYEERRRVEMSIMRDYLNDLPQQSHFIVAGDFNIYNASTEPGFEIITSPGSDIDGQLFDPLNRIGDWHADIGETDCEYADVHTQSTRVLDFGDGATGGMDDRFDWIMVSAAVLEETNEINYLDGTYTSYGNDGNHCNQAIYQGSNSAVSQSIAYALHAASDHLPVTASFQFSLQDTTTASISSESKTTEKPILHGWYPNPFNPYSIFKYNLPKNSFVNISIIDLLGRHVKTLINKSQLSGVQTVAWNGTDQTNNDVPSGIYYCRIKVSQFEAITKIVFLK